MITLMNLGDVAMVTLPGPEAARPLGEPHPTAVSYTTPGAVAAVAAECQRALAARGWHEVGPSNVPQGDTPVDVHHPEASTGTPIPSPIPDSALVPSPTGGTPQVLGRSIGGKARQETSEYPSH